MVLSDRTQDMIRAKVYLLIEDRNVAKESAHDILTYLSKYQPRPEATTIKFLIPLPVTLRGALCMELPDKTMDTQVITLYRVLKNFNGKSYDIDWMVE